MESNILVKCKKVFKEHKGALYSIIQAKEKHLVFAAGSDRHIIEFDLKSLEAKRLVAKSAAAVLSMLYFSDKNHLLIGQAEGGVHVVNLNENIEIHYLKIHTGYLFDLNYIQEKNEIIFSSGDGSISVWNASDYTLLYHKKLSDSKLRKMDYSKSRREIAIACGDGTVKVLSIVDYQEKYSLTQQNSSINTIKYNPLNDSLLVGEKDAHLSLYNLKSKEKELDLAAHYWAIYDIVYRSDYTYFATGSRDKTIKIWETSRMVVLKRIEGLKEAGHTHSVNGLLWSEFEDNLISIGDDGTVRIWSII